MLAKRFAAFALALAAPVALPMEFELDDTEGRKGLVSVVIPTYNRAYTLGDTIRSVLDQTYRDVEVIVVDDGSSDDTPELVREFGDEVSYFRQDNAGVCAARNRGLRECRGEFVALLDSDDQWLPWKLESQIRVLRQFPDVGMVWTDMIAVDDRGKHLEQAYLRHFYSAHQKIRIESVLHDEGRVEHPWPEAPVEAASAHVYRGDLFSAMILGNLVHTSTVVLRRDRLAVIGGFDTRLARSGEDYEFHLRTCSQGAVAFLDASSILYRVGADDQLTAPKYNIDLARNNLETVRRWIAMGGSRIQLDEDTLRERLAESYAWLGEQEFLSGQARQARGHLRQSLHAAKPTARRVGMLAFTFLPRDAFDAANRWRKSLRRAMSSL